MSMSTALKKHQMRRTTRAVHRRSTAEALRLSRQAQAVRNATEIGAFTEITLDAGPDAPEIYRLLRADPRVDATLDPASGIITVGPRTSGNARASKQFANVLAGLGKY